MTELDAASLTDSLPGVPVKWAPDWDAPKPGKVPKRRRLLQGLKPKHKQAAKLLAAGRQTKDVAAVVGLGPSYLSRVVQTPEFRAELDANLRRIQEQAQRLIAYGLTKRLESIDPAALQKRVTAGGLPEAPLYTPREVADDALSPSVLKAAGVSDRVSFDVDSMIERELARIRGQQTPPTD